MQNQWVSYFVYGVIHIFVLELPEKNGFFGILVDQAQQCQGYFHQVVPKSIFEKFSFIICIAFSTLSHLKCPNFPYKIDPLTWLIHGLST